MTMYTTPSPKQNVQAETDEARTAEAAKLEAGMRVMEQFLKKHGHPEGPFLLGRGDGAYCVGALIVFCA